MVIVNHVLPFAVNPDLSLQGLPFESAESATGNSPEQMKYRPELATQHKKGASEKVAKSEVIARTSREKQFCIQVLNFPSIKIELACYDNIKNINKNATP